MALELTFVNQYANGSLPKRRRLAKACDSCRQRKKRCMHFADSGDIGEGRTTHIENSIENDTPDDPNATHLPTPSTRIDSVNVPSTSSSNDKQPLTASSTSNIRRFISDINPESTFLQRQPASDKPTRPEDDVGIWVDRREYDLLVRQKNGASDSELGAVAGSQRPHSAVVGLLIDVYFGKVHPVLPLLNEAEFRRRHAADRVPEVLVHAVCLVAAKHADASPHLQLNESTTPLPPREFCSRLHSSVIAALRAPAKLDKITLIRSLALTSLHAEGPEGAEEATMCLNNAMHYTQTLGWHLAQHSGVASNDDLETKRLFWCLWSLDRINSCIYGRPIMMSDIDIAIEPFESGESGFPAFETWLYLCRTLNKVISFYRPGISLDVGGWEDDFPSFEDAMEQGKAWNLDQPTLATLHLFYLLIAILSHRSRGVKYVPRSTPSYVRQSLCAIELNRLMSSHLLPALLPLPILPYAVSLSLSVSYQHLRQAQLQHQQEDARQDFRGCCQVLQKLRRTWSSADVIATISKKVLDQLDRAPDLAAFRIAKTSEMGRNSPHICTASFWKPHTIIDHPSADSPTTETRGGSGNATEPQQEQQQSETDWLNLFEGMDDIFGTYLDPNYPVNLDDFSFVDDLSSLDWNVSS